MVSKNNIEIKKRRLAKQVPHYGLRRLSVGVASVLLGTSFYLGGTVAHADTTTGVQPTVANTEENSNNSAGSLTFSTSTSGSSSNAKTIAAPTSTVSAPASSNTSAEPATNTAANSADSSSSAPAVKTPAASSSAVSANNGSSASSSASSTSSSANPAAAKKINVNDLKQADFGAAVALNTNLTQTSALNTNLTQTSDDTTVVKPSAPITDDSFKGQTLDENKALVGTGKQASIQLSDGSSLSIDNNVIDPSKNTAILTFKSNSFKAGDSYQIVIDKNHGITLSETDIAKLQPSFGTTVFKETDDQYIITDHFINDGTISQAIKLSYDTSTSLPWSFAKMTANVSVVKNSDSSSIKTLPVNVIAPELQLDELLGLNSVVGYNHHNVDFEYEMAVFGSYQPSTLKNSINTLTVQISKLPPYFTATSCSINLNGTSISVPIVNGKATFTREQLDKLSITDNDYSPILAIYGRFDVPDNLFTHSKYIVKPMDDGVTVNLAYKNNYGSLNSSTSLSDITILDGNAKFTTGDVLGYLQDYSAYFADNDYSKGGISADTIPVIGNGSGIIKKWK